MKIFIELNTIDDYNPEDEEYNVNAIYVKSGMMSALQKFTAAIVQKHIEIYLDSDKCQKITADLEEKIMEEVPDILINNIDVKEDDYVVNEIENTNSWAEMDIDNLISEYEEEMDAAAELTDVPDNTISKPLPPLIPRLETVQDDDDPDIGWNVEPDEPWTCDHVNKEKEETEISVAWDTWG